YGIADERDTEPDLILPLRAAEGTAAIFVEDGGGENQPFRPGNGLGVPEGRGGVKGDEVGEHVIDTVLAGSAVVPDQTGDLAIVRMVQHILPISAHFVAHGYYCEASLLQKLDVEFSIVATIISRLDSEIARMILVFVGFNL